MQNLNRTYKLIEDFGDLTVELARRNLNLNGFGGQKRNRKKNATGKLSKGLGYIIKLQENRLVLSFTSKEDYAGFIEEGTRPSTKSPSVKMVLSIVRWIRKKPIRLRKKSGQFVNKNPNNFKKAAYGIAKSRLKRGSKPVPFFSEAIDEAYEKKKDEIGEAIALDLEDIIFNDFQKNK